MKLGRPARRRDVLNWHLVFRSAATGQYVTRLFALINPAHTVSERRSTTPH